MGLDEHKRKNIFFGIVIFLEIIFLAYLLIPEYFSITSITSLLSKKNVSESEINSFMSELYHDMMQYAIAGNSLFHEQINITVRNESIDFILKPSGGEYDFLPVLLLVSPKLFCFPMSTEIVCPSGYSEPDKKIEEIFASDISRSRAYVDYQSSVITFIISPFILFNNNTLELDSFEVSFVPSFDEIYSEVSMDISSFERGGYAVEYSFSLSYMDFDSGCLEIGLDFPINISLALSLPSELISAKILEKDQHFFTERRLSVESKGDNKYESSFSTNYYLESEPVYRSLEVCW